MATGDAYCIATGDAYCIAPCSAYGGHRLQHRGSHHRYMATGSV